MISAIEGVEPVCFLDDGVKPGTRVRGVEVIGGADAFRTLDPSLRIIIALGDPLQKARIAGVCRSQARTFLTLIHPSVIIQHQDSVHIGDGTVIQAGCILTNDIEVGTNVLINLNCTIGHGVRIGDNASVMPGSNLAGNVMLGECVLVGSGSNIINGIHIGDRSRIGAGSVVISNIPGDVLAVGVPAGIKRK